MLQAQTTAKVNSTGYRSAVDEIVRGIRLVSGLGACSADPGWVAVECGDAVQARWLSEQIRQENVASYAEGARFFVPAGECFTLKAEIKSVVTAVAKTTHYWGEHMPSALKNSLAWEDRLQRWSEQVRNLWRT